MGNYPGRCHVYRCLKYPGQNATDIGAGGFGVAIIGNGTNDDKAIYNWTGQVWGTIPGSAQHVAVGPNSIHVTNSWYGLWEWGGYEWTNIFPANQSQDVGVGSDGTFCYIGPPNSNITLNGNITCQTGTNQTSYPGAGYRIDVKSDGSPVVVTDTGNVFEWVDPSGWVQLQGFEMADVAVDADDIVWAVSNDSYWVYRWGGTEFHLDGTGIAGAMRIAADAKDNIWVVETDNSVISFRKNPF